MRIATLCVLFGLAGCANPNEPEAPAPAATEDVPQCAVEVPEEPHIPQHPDNLWDLEHVRKVGDPLAERPRERPVQVREQTRRGDGGLPARPVARSRRIHDRGVYLGGNPRISRGQLHVIARNGKLVRASRAIAVLPDLLRRSERRATAGVGRRISTPRSAHFNLPPLPPPAPPRRPTRASPRPARLRKRTREVRGLTRCAQMYS